MNCENESISILIIIIKLNEKEKIMEERKVYEEKQI